MTVLESALQQRHACSVADGRAAAPMPISEGPTTSTRRVSQPEAAAAARPVPWAIIGAVSLLGITLLSACGGRTAPSLAVRDAGPGPGSERCDGRDNDDDGRVDEGYRDTTGRYVGIEHCGGCGEACTDLLPGATDVECALIADRPRCVAQACLPGYALSEAGRCLSIAEQLCMPCVSDIDCQGLPGARCTTVGGLPHCTIGCDGGCPQDYPCGSDDLGVPACLPVGGDCSCDAGEQFTIACAPEGRRDCVGQQRCEGGVRSECEIPEELCDAIDNDCDGSIDELFVDERGAYTVDPAHCGRCGVDCNAGLDDELQLTCGGDPFAPTCVVRCPDIDDGGIQVGDRIDTDGRLDNGCECIVDSLTDEVGLDNGVIDPNCDGADGQVTRSVYVSAEGDDLAPGSPTRPMRTISAAVRVSALSLGTGLPRPDVFVAAGTYAESVEMAQGVRLHAGYRTDFLALDPGGFEVHVVAPLDTQAPHGAALVLDGVTSALVEGLRLTGVDRSDRGAPAVGVVVRDASASVVLRDLDIRSGRPGGGEAADTGENGAEPATAAGAGLPQRAALEDQAHICITGLVDNTGGAGGRNVCDGDLDVSGGDGGTASCPFFNQPSQSGQPGNHAINVLGGDGGMGGDGVGAPLGLGQSCQSPPCCGLADYYVGFGYEEATAGQPGRDGQSGLAGAACDDALGRFGALAWTAGSGTAGSAGRPGSAGGGGGAGGGSQFEWNPANSCTYADGLGGSGGGGGGGGCGGAAGEAGASGGPAIGLLVIADSVGAQPQLVGCTIASENGARGGDGGGGGDGGLGGAGGLGGVLPREQRITPTLAGAQPGSRGGKGGNGGAGGGGGGGCGGPSVGVWVSGRGAGGDDLNYRGLNGFALGGGGEAGRGGGGAVSASDGATGAQVDVLVR